MKSWKLIALGIVTLMLTFLAAYPVATTASASTQAASHPMNSAGGVRDCPGTTHLTIHAYFIGWGDMYINEGLDGTAVYKNLNYQWHTLTSSRSRQADWGVVAHVYKDPAFWVDKAYTTCDD